MSNQNKPFNRLQAKDKEELNPKQFPIMKRAYAAYMDDVLDDSIPDVVLSAACEKGYIQGYLSGCKDGANMANEIHDEVFSESPTLNRYTGTGIADEQHKECIN